VNASPETRLRAADLRDMNTTPERVRRWFQQNYGMTFSDWSRGIRLSRAFTQLRNGTRIEDAMLGNGFHSHSGFAEALTRTFGEPIVHGNGRTSSRAQSRDAVEVRYCIRITMLETPLGPMVAAANDKGVCLLEFADRRGLKSSYADMRRRFRSAVLPGENAILKQLRDELAQYFAGERREFSVPVCVNGTPFQENVWRELRIIPAGKTASYEAIAERVGNSRAVRAVARANGTNRVCILIPCHRVIAKDGTLSGYGGGVWRKRLLLELERRGALEASSRAQPRDPAATLT
jgi:AraC family transcriptional regulator of adaptative response/methylated-DNA-[protein]-cysteine methyltransferase